VGGDANEDEDAGSDDRAHSEAGELDRAEHAAEPVVAVHLLEQDVERLLREQLM
jgi:hypothetical protein